MNASVSEVIKYFKKEFDADYISKKMAIKAILNKADYIKEEKMLGKNSFDLNYFLDKYKIEYNTFDKKREELRNDWSEKSEQSRKRGNEIHSMLEAKDSTTFKYVSNLIDSDNEYKSCDKLNFDTDKAYFSEYSMKVQYGHLCLSGRSDLMIKDGNKISIVEYKTFEKVKRSSAYSNRGKATLKYPLTSVQDCNLHTTALQLSFYAYMLKKLHPELEIDKLILCHIDHNNKVHNEVVANYEDLIETALDRYIIENETKDFYSSLELFNY